MAFVYILYSQKINSFYTGSCKNLEQRIEDHNKGLFKNSFTAKTNDWKLYFSIDNLVYQQARNIETHLKNMKSKKYFQDLKQYPEIVQKLIIIYK